MMKLILYRIKYLYSINYLWINSSSFSGKKTLIKDFKNKIKTYKGISITKFVLFWCCYITIFSIMILASIEEYAGNDIFSFESNERKSNVLVIIFIVCITIFITSYLIILIICFYYHFKYIKDFMNDINLDFQNDKNDYKWNVIVIIFFILTINYSIFKKKKKI